MKTIGKSHMGLVRKKNEDRYLIRQINDTSVLLAVADGMGGQPAGELAAEIAIEKMSETEFADQDINRQFLMQLTAAKEAMHNLGKTDPDLEDMGTTLTAALIRNHILFWVHIGDSRLYLIRDSKPVQITTDHTMAQSLLEEGVITAEDFKNHHARNFLINSLGCGEFKPDTGRIETKAGDWIVLTSDGLHGNLDEKEFEAALSQKKSPEEFTQHLIENALEAGGSDNITIVMACL